MQQTTAEVRHYDAVTIALHWATAVLIALQWVGAQIIDVFPVGPLRVDARSVHIAGGLLLVLILASRLVWRFTRGRRLQPVETGVMNLLAKATHGSLYLLVAAMLAAGVFLVWIRGDNIFNLFTIPAFDPGNKPLRSLVNEIHGTIGNVILALAGLHAVAAIYHQYVRGDGVLARMIPRLESTPPSA